MRNKKRNRILFLLILLLGIGIGFAALATTLKINGSAIITKNTWNIYWDNVANETGVTPTSETEILNEDINHQKNIVSFTVTLDQPGDFYEFEVDAVNAGTLDAEIISIAKKYNGTLIPAVEDPEHRVVPAYLKYEVTYADTGEPAVGDKLAKRTDATHFTTKTYKIRVEYDRNAVTNTDINGQVGDVECTFTLEVEYGQATPEVGPASAVAFATDDWATIAAEGNRAATQTSLDNELSCGVYNVGDTKTIQFDFDGDGTNENYTVRIANCSTPAVCSTTGFSETSCGFVVEFAEVLTRDEAETFMYNLGGGGAVSGTGNNGSWPATNLRAYLNNGIYALQNRDYTSTGFLSVLPSDLTEQLATTTVVSGHGYGYDTENFTSTDKIFLLAPHEVYLDIVDDGAYLTYLDRDTDYNNTRQLDYYENLNVTTSSYADAKKKNIFTGEYDEWWMRSPRNSASDIFYNVSTNGYCDYNYATTNDSGKATIGLSPAFKLSN